MIELRWLESTTYSDPDTGEHFLTPRKYRKLQFRVVESLVENGGKAGPLYRQKWGEWKDVPVSY